MVLGTEVGLSPGDFVLDGDPAHPLNFRLMFIIVIVISLEHCTIVIGMFKFKFWYSMHSIFTKKSLIVLSLSSIGGLNTEANIVRELNH